MAVLFLLSILVRRDYEPFSSLSLAAMLILIFRPRQLYDIGFQLSFISVLAIFLLAPLFAEIFPNEWRERFWIKGIILSGSVSVAAWIGTAGLIAYYFGMITPIALVANLIIVPLLFIIVLSGILLIIGGCLFPALTPGLALNCELLFSFLHKINAKLIVLPGAYFEGRYISARASFVYYAGVLGLVALLKYLKYRRNPMHI